MAKEKIIIITCEPKEFNALLGMEAAKLESECNAIKSKLLYVFPYEEDEYHHYVRMTKVFQYSN